jgi:hypothetical protein
LGAHPGDGNAMCLTDIKILLEAISQGHRKLTVGDGYQAHTVSPAQLCCAASIDRMSSP